VKRIKLIIFISFAFTSLYAQNASDYFPSQPGYTWNYESIPLDSLNNPVNAQKFFSIDSFAIVAPYHGKNANIVLSKTGPQITINIQPYTDSIYYNFDASSAYEYFNPEIAAGMLGVVDSVLGINFLNFFNSLKGWYSYYRMSSGVNTSYQIFSKDTTVIVNSTELPIRLQLIGKRLADETINTAIGTFDCKKFLLEVRLSYLVWFPPLPDPLPVPILSVGETVWLAPGNWKVKSYIPSTNVDLFVLGIPDFNIPGLETNIIMPITNVRDEKLTVDNFELYKNYPNPFNPSTIIKYSISRADFVSLKIYNLMGEEVGSLENEYKPAGSYTINYNPASRNKNIASGIYFYQLTVGGLSQVKKMTLLK